MKITVAELAAQLPVDGLDVAREYQLGLSTSALPGTLSFLDSEKYAQSILDNKNIVAVITTEALRPVLQDAVEIFVSAEPRYDYYMLYNALAKRNYVQTPSEIDPSAQIHPRAYVSEFNVKIGPRTIVHPNATIMADVEIGADCIIHPGAVVGAEGFEYKKTSKGILPVFHDGKSILKDRVDIGPNANVDKGFSARPTIIGEESKIDKFCHVSHGVQIGRRTLVTAGSILGGSLTIGDDAWIGLNATLLPGITIGDRGFVSMGAVVTRSVGEGEQVTGNFAIPHRQFLAHLKTMK